MAKISVVICCTQAADTLPAACDSVAWADELVIVDSGSTDGTAEIAQARADVYRQEPWRGYSAQKAFAATLARHDWVLILDADEEVDERLAQEIQGLTAEALSGADVVYMRRQNFVFGRHARGWDPDWQSRLIHRHRATWNDDALHDARAPADRSRRRYLRGRLLHKRVSEAGFEDYFGGARLDARLLPVARQMYERGRRCRWLDLWLRPKAVMFKQLVLKRGLLDGSFGYLIAQKTAFTTQLKYAALWAIQNGNDQAQHLEHADSRSRAGQPEPLPDDA